MGVMKVITSPAETVANASGMSSDTKGLFFLCLFAVGVWLVVDAAIGEKYILKFLKSIFPSLYK